MATYDELIAAFTKQADAKYNPLNDTVKNDYQTQINNLTAQYQNSLGIANQDKATIPGQFQPARESAYLASQKAALAAPAVVSNQGYASGSGLNYDYLQGLNSTWQKSVDTANKGQDAANLQAQNNINTMGINYNTSNSDLASKEAAALANIGSQRSDYITTNATNQYNIDQAAIAAAQVEAARAAQAQAQYDRDMAEQQRQYNQTQATQQRQYNQSRADSQAGAKAKAKATAAAPTIEAIVPNFIKTMSGNGKMNDYNTLNGQLDYYGISDPAQRQQALTMAGLQNAPQESETGVWNAMSAAGNQSHWNKQIMKQVLDSRYNEGSINGDAYTRMVQHYGL
jgi:hypothetical protein